MRYYGPGAAPAPGGSGAKVNVVAAENFWGSIAAQLGGTKVSETSIITNPQTADPHAYEPTAADARTIHAANLQAASRLEVRLRPVDGPPTAVDAGALHGAVDDTSRRTSSQVCAWPVLPTITV